MNSRRNENHGDDLRFSFRNTRSKFYKKKESDMDSPGDQSEKESPEKNTGNYWKEQGNIEFKKGNINKAIEHYTKAIELSPGQSVFYCNRAKCYKLQENYQLALKDAQEACELEPESIKANYICGCLLAEMGKYDKTKLPKAENKLKKALRLCSSHKKEAYEEDISIKYYRLKKLMYYLELEEEIEDLTLEKNILSKNNTTEPKYKRVMFLSEIKILERIEKKLEELKNNRTNQEIPDYLCCKITLELMEEPVMTEEGLTYEKSAIEDYFKINGMIEPITRKKLTSKPSVNIALKNAIEDFLKQNPWAFEHGLSENYHDIKF